MSEIIPIAYESKEANVTASAQNISAFAFNASLLPKAEEMLVTAKGVDVMFYIDGTTPTASNGHIMVADSTWRIVGAFNLANFRFIARSGTGTISATIMGTNWK